MLIATQQTDHLQILTNQKLKQMYQDKKQSSKLLIPKNLSNFVKTKQFMALLSAVYAYSLSFNEIIKIYTTISQKMQGRIQQIAILLKKQKQQLGFLQRQISYHYAAILLSFNCQCISQKKRSNFRDQVFFQALLYLIQHVIKQLFTRQQYQQIQQQINRLFRTNRYNLIKKRHENQQMFHKYPVLKQIKNNKIYTLKKTYQRQKAFRKYQNQKKYHLLNDYTSMLGTIKQLDYPDLKQRSPLLCTWLPSKKSMLGQFSISSQHTNNMVSVQKKSTSQTVPLGNEAERKTRIASLGSIILNSGQI